MSIECFIQAELEYNVEKVGTSQKSISRKPLAYTKRKRNGEKKPFVKGFIIYLLKLMKITLNLKNEQIHNALLHALIFIYIFFFKMMKRK